jgi:flagellar biosynthesis protein FlhF
VPGDRVLFFGPAGAGKTSALGKLAARLVFQEKQKVTLVSLDAMKVGAAEEIQSYGDIIGSTVQTQEDALSTKDSNGITLIDTSALPRQIDQITTLRSQIDALRPNYRFAVFSALMRSDDIVDFAEAISAIRPSHILMTGLDLTDRWGGLFAACAAAKQSLAFTSNTPGGIGALITPDAAAFVRKLLETEEGRG